MAFSYLTLYSVFRIPYSVFYIHTQVKIQADCPTWNNLTALEYHFATQCLPGPLAWYGHQLHPFILRLSVAMTFLIEIQGAFLLIFWKPAFRKVGAWLQITLQAMIILSGNYNFFNALTIALCLPCLESSTRTKDEKERKSSKKVCVSTFYPDTISCSISRTQPLIANCIHSYSTSQFALPS